MTTKIEIDLDKLEPHYKDFINFTIATCEQADVSVLLSKERDLPYNETGVGRCNGYFCDDSLTMATACGQDFDKWFSVFIHESSHFDQWYEDDPVWAVGKIDGWEAADIMELWLQGTVELNSKQKLNIANRALAVELDCERRTIEKIQEWDLPMDTEYYAQRANAYVWFYHYLMLTRKWYTIGKEPYNIPELVAAMPKDMEKGNYSKLPVKIENAFIEHMRY